MSYDTFSSILTHLSELYNIEEDENKIYQYLSIRTSIMKDKKKVNDSEIMQTIVRDLNLPVDYSGSLPSLKIRYVSNDKIFDETITLFDLQLEFLDNLKFRANLKGIDNLEDFKIKILREGYQKSYKYRYLPNFQDQKKYYRLQILNSTFNANPKSCGKIKPFVYEDNYDFFKRTEEERLTSLIEAQIHGKSNSTAMITEADLEKYLIKNLDLIEKDLVFISNQFPVESGFIDILAKDKFGCFVVIELKVKQDKSLLWQASHYPSEIKRLYSVKNVRMITLSPSYSKSLLEGLQKIGSIESKSYEIEVKNRKISSIKIKGED